MDGQLARLRKTDSPYGASVDGICDHICGISIYLIFLNKFLSSLGFLSYALIFLAVFSRFIQAATYELQRALYDFWIKKGDKKWPLSKNKQLSSHRIFFFLKKLYDFFQIKFSGVDLSLVTYTTRKDPNQLAEYYKQHFTRLVKRWSLMSDNYRYLVLFITCLFKVPILFFILEVTVWNALNVFLIACYKRKEQAFKSWLQGPQS